MVQSRFRIVVVATVANGVEVGDSEVAARYRYGCSPCIIGIFCNEVTAGVVDAAGGGVFLPLFYQKKHGFVKEKM